MPTGDGNWGNVTGLDAGGGFGMVVPASAGGAAAMHNATTVISGAHPRIFRRAKELATPIFVSPSLDMDLACRDSTSSLTRRW